MVKRKYIRFFLCMILSVALLLTMSGSVFAVESQDAVVIDDEEETDEMVPIDEIELVGYSEVAKSGDLTMYANMENGYFYLENSVTGKQWHSVPIDTDYDEVSKGAATRGKVRSQLMISYINREEMELVEYAQEANSNSDSLQEGGVTAKTITNGIRVEYFFPAIGITVPVEYTLKDGLFYANVILGEIKEEPVGTDMYMLIDITVLPAFGAGNWATEGNLLVPDGSGALVGFNNGAKLASGYQSMVYGKDMSVVNDEKVTSTETIRLPVFGTMIGEDALMGIISKGDGASSITLINGNDRCGYNAIGSIFHYRVMQAQRNIFNKRMIHLVAEPELGIDTYEVRYEALTGEDADYIGIATAYREYLIKEKGLTKQDTTPSFHMDAIGAFEQAATFLGIIPYTEKVPLTTFEQCQTILEDLKTVGIEDISLRYLGWSNNGMENVKLPKNANALKVLGGNKKLDVLKEYTATKGIDLYTDVDLLTFKKNGNGVKDRKDGIRNVFGKITYQPKYMLSTYVTVLNSAKTVYLTPNRIADVATRYLEAMKARELTGVSLSGIGEQCYSDYYEDNAMYRTTYPDMIAKTLQAYKDAGVAMTFDGGNAFVLPYASLITNVPLNSSGYDIFTEDVPFYQAVLHGYIPYTTKSIAQTADPLAIYLSAVESGSELMYIGIYTDAAELFDTAYNHLYGSTWTLWKERAAAQYKEYMPILKKVKDQVIVDHREIAEEVFLTEYADGTQIAVNYNDEAVTVQGQTIPAKGFSECVWEEVSIDE